MSKLAQMTIQRLLQTKTIVRIEFSYDAGANALVLLRAGAVVQAGARHEALQCGAVQAGAEGGRRGAGCLLL